MAFLNELIKTVEDLKAKYQSVLNEQKKASGIKTGSTEDKVLAMYTAELNPIALTGLDVNSIMNKVKDCSNDYILACKKLNGEEIDDTKVIDKEFFEKVLLTCK